MAKIKHNGEWMDTGLKEPVPVKQGPLRIGDVIVQPGATAEVPGWDRIAARSAAIKAWLRVGIIEVVDGDDASDDASDDAETVEKREIIAKLAALNISKTERTSLDKLRKTLAEAEAAGTPVVKLPGLS